MNFSRHNCGMLGLCAAHGGQSSFRDTRLRVDRESRRFTMSLGSGFEAEPVIGPRFCADPLASPRNDELRPLDPGFRGKADGAVPADVVEMPVEELSRRALAGAVQQFEEVVIGLHFARSGKTGAERAEIDAMDIKPAVFVPAGAARQ